MSEKSQPEPPSAERQFEQQLASLKARAPKFDFDALCTDAMGNPSTGSSVAPQAELRPAGRFSYFGLVAACATSAAISAVIVFGIMQSKISKLEYEFAHGSSPSMPTDRGVAPRLTDGKPKQSENVQSLVAFAPRRERNILFVGSHLSEIAFPHRDEKSRGESGGGAEALSEPGHNSAPSTRATILDSLQGV